MNTEYLKSKLEVERDRFKVGISLIVIITSGLVGIVVKKDMKLSDYILAFGGAIADVFMAFYTFKTYHRVNKILKLMEDKNG